MVSYGRGTPVRIRRLWDGKEPGGSKLLSKNRQSWVVEMPPRAGLSRCTGGFEATTQLFSSKPGQDEFARQWNAINCAGNPVYGRFAEWNVLGGGSEAGSYLRRIDFVHHYHSTLGLRVKKKRRWRDEVASLLGETFFSSSSLLSLQVLEGP